MSRAEPTRSTRGARAAFDAGEVTGIVRAAFGRRRRIEHVERLSGGSKKGVYRVVLDNSFSATLYVWSSGENFWPEHDKAEVAGPLADASGIDLFLSAHTHLERLGLPTPALYFSDTSKTIHPSDVAFVQDVPGPSLESRLEHDMPEIATTMRLLSDTLRTMHGHRSGELGRAGNIGNTILGQARRCEQIVAARALHHLDAAASRVERVAQVREQLKDALRHLESCIQPRSHYTLIHGEMGPDHVLVDQHARPYIIDIEGLMYFDVEWEHAFLEFRFGKHYPWFSRTDLDQRRLQLYRLALHLSLVAGPLQLLDGDYPDRQRMIEIIAWNLEKALSYVE